MAGRHDLASLPQPVTVECPVSPSESASSASGSMQPRAFHHGEASVR